MVLCVQMVRCVRRKPLFPPWYSRLVGAMAVSVAVVYAVVVQVLPVIADQVTNRVAPTSPPPVPSDAALALHRSLFVADLHIDPTLWTHRDLTKRYSYGHTDLPRLLDGGVSLAVFAAVTKVPFPFRFDHNSNSSDVIIPLIALAQQWPFRTVSSLFARAELHARVLHATAERAGGALHIVKSQADLAQLRSAQAANPGQVVGGLLAIEGAHVLEGSLENVDRLYALGFRMIGPTHFFDNELGGSAHGEGLHGLTSFGRQVVRRMEELGIIVDVAHSSPQIITDVLAMATRPVVVSHGGVKGTCNNSRTLSDEHVRGIARTGGVIGITFFRYAVCDVTVEAIVEAITYVCSLVGCEHAALGSDFDGTVTTPIDASQMASVTQALMSAGFDEQTVRGIMGGNFLRVREMRKLIRCSSLAIRCLRACCASGHCTHFSHVLCGTVQVPKTHSYRSCCRTEHTGGLADGCPCVSELGQN
jgi:membrane dipeptidase